LSWTKLSPTSPERHLSWAARLTSGVRSVTVYSPSGRYSAAYFFQIDGLFSRQNRQVSWNVTRLKNVVKDNCSWLTAEMYAKNLLPYVRASLHFVIVTLQKFLDTSIWFLHGGDNT
jgi:hypothetical protein